MTRINTNVSSLIARNVLNKSNNDLQQALTRRELKKLASGSAAPFFLRGGQMPYLAGARLRQPVLAETLARLAGRLDFNPLSDPLTSSDGREITLKAPEPAADLPPEGFVFSEEGLQLPPGDRAAVEVAVEPGSERLALLEPFTPWGADDFTGHYLAAHVALAWWLQGHNANLKLDLGLVKPYGLLISAGNDGRGAVAQAQRILRGIPFTAAAEPLILRGEVAPQVDLSRRL